MLLLCNTWIILVLLLQIILPLDGKQATESSNKKISRKEDEERKERFGLNSTRSLDAIQKQHYDPHKRPHHREYSHDTAHIIYVFVAVFLIIIGLIIKCCIQWASEPGDGVRTVMVHAPPARPPLPSRQLPTASRIRPNLAPPRTSSRSLILLPEDRAHENLFFGIENPNYIPAGNYSTAPEDRIRENLYVGIQNPDYVPTRSNSTIPEDRIHENLYFGTENPNYIPVGHNSTVPQDRISARLYIGIENPNFISAGNNSPVSQPKSITSTPLLDKPPGYDEVVRSGNKYNKMPKKDDDSPPPKYDD